MSSIQYATSEDIPRIMRFIDEEWKEGHILARDEDFFSYEYESSPLVNFLISKDRKGDITGMLGFITSNLSGDSGWATMWKVSRRAEKVALGIEMMHQLHDRMQGGLFSVGINRGTAEIYRRLGYTVGTVDHFVILNHQMKAFNIAKVNPVKKSEVRGLEAIGKTGNLRSVELINDFNQDVDDFDFNPGEGTLPLKDKWYLNKRYFRHPIYKYLTFGIRAGGKLEALIVLREQALRDSSALRIVDFIGREEALGGIGPWLREKMISGNFEYVDFLCYGIGRTLLEREGFVKINQDSSDLVIPNYFSPYVRENIKIMFFADVSNKQRIRICKGDGDQDRPS